MSTLIGLRSALATLTAAVVLAGCGSPGHTSVGGSVYVGTGYYNGPGWNDPWRGPAPVYVGPPPHRPPPSGGRPMPSPRPTGRR